MVVGQAVDGTAAAKLVHAVKVVAAVDALVAPSLTRRLIADFTRQAEQVLTCEALPEPSLPLQTNPATPLGWERGNGTRRTPAAAARGAQQPDADRT
ncbi:MAG: hypothetical protein WA895_37650, partial [Streptosporangiaceae bacterium]